MQQLKKMGFVRFGVFHIPMKPESLENADMFTLQSGGKASRLWCVLQRRYDQGFGLGFPGRCGAAQTKVCRWDHILPQQHGKDPTERTTSAGAREIWGKPFCEEHQELEQKAREEGGALGKEAQRTSLGIG